MTLRAITLLALCAGCQQELGRPPVPRFTIDPGYVPLHDAFATEVTLDATESADALDDPEATLGYDWTFDDDVRIVRGDSRTPVVAFTTAGERAVTIALRVEDPDGQHSTLEQRLGVTIPEP